MTRVVTVDFLLVALEDGGREGGRRLCGTLLAGLFGLFLALESDEKGLGLGEVGRGDAGRLGAADGAMWGSAAAQCAVSRTPTTTRATPHDMTVAPMVLLSTAKTSAAARRGAASIDRSVTR